MTVDELIKRLAGLPREAQALNGKPTSLGTLVGVQAVGTVKVVLVEGRLVPGHEFREPLNVHDEPDVARIVAVVIR